MEKKVCLMVTADPMYWVVYKKILLDLGVKVFIAESVAKVPELLKDQKFDFALVNGTMTSGAIPGVNYEVNPFRIGIDYTSPYLDEKNIPYIILTLVDVEINKTSKTLKKCLGVIKYLGMNNKEIKQVLEEKFFKEVRNEYLIARYAVNAVIKTKMEFEFPDLERAIKANGGIMRIAPNVTIAEYLDGLEDDGIIKYIPKKNKFIVINPEK